MDTGIVPLLIEATNLLDEFCRIGVSASRIVVLIATIPLIWRVSTDREP